MASGFETSNISDFLSFLSKSNDDSDLAADSDILLDAVEEVLHSSESDICDERNGSSRDDGSWDDDEPSPSSRFTTTDWVSKASTVAKVSDEGDRENGRDDGGSDSDVESDGECPPPKRAKCAKRDKKEPECRYCFYTGTPEKF